MLGVIRRYWFDQMWQRGGVANHGAAGKLISNRSTLAEVQATLSRALALGTGVKYSPETIAKHLKNNHLHLYGIRDGIQCPLHDFLRPDASSSRDPLTQWYGK